MVCPKGWHPIGRFLVVDRLKRVTVAAEADKEGMSDMAIEKPSIAPVPKQSTKKIEVLLAAKFADTTGWTMFVHLRRMRTARSGDVFTVSWARHQAGKVESTGVLARETYAERGREAFAGAKKAALADGWQEVALMAHAPKFAPLPKPGAAKKGR